MNNHDFKEWAAYQKWYLINTREWNNDTMLYFYFSPSGNAYFVELKGDFITDIQEVKVNKISIDYKNIFHIDDGFYELYPEERV
ncbi:hypothetical protein LCGC14_1206430 [marine sediment metagenome]|uniref:Uncharacterized protein n=1 Tax=marine sediment metagenome TaxID=412755 RepID=A0A0F9M2R8_9ZZZZ